MELPYHRVMAQCDFLNGDQVGRTIDGLGHSLARSIGLVMSPVGPNWERSLRSPKTAWMDPRAKQRARSCLGKQLV